MEAMEISEELVAAGIPEPQAKAIAKTQVASARAAAKESKESLATKADLAQLKADILAMIVWAMAGTITANTAIMALLLSLFHNAPK